MFGKFFPYNRALYEVMWKNMLRERQATDDSIIRRMRFACWMTKAADTHTQTHTHTRVFNTLLLFHSNNGYANAPQCNVTRYTILPVFC
jgi:hypothetical protein